MYNFNFRDYDIHINNLFIFSLDFFSTIIFSFPVDCKTIDFNKIILFLKATGYSVDDFLNQNVSNFNDLNVFANKEINKSTLKDSIFFNCGFFNIFWLTTNYNFRHANLIGHNKISQAKQFGMHQTQKRKNVTNLRSYLCILQI
ncbi:hypothetical protein BpHYR1_048215 [Brachionus plicatilis]|uniref:Uncharacterized protein n=1 Tax=Brachionus plicatilis TaxID=10195 RepID=A0A3M7RYI0_BRAPC|nr:hypothetical protein BpHYR1_048215 [Brachionus plicatilis]